MAALGLDVTEIGYLFGLIQHCSRSNTYDGRLKPFAARTIAEVDDPDAVLAHLNDAGQIQWDGKLCVVLHLDDHLPPPHMREEARKPAERNKKRRQRAHAKGNHSLCSFPACPAAVVPGTVPGTDEGQSSPEQPCPPDVPGTVGYGTGQDGPGQGSSPTVPRQREIGWEECPSCSTLGRCACVTT